MKWSDLAPKVKFSLIEPGTDLKKEFPEFPIWEWGTGRYSKTLGGMETKIKDGKIILADYEYEYSRQMHAPAAVDGMNRALTFCILQHENLNFPAIHMRNEAPVHKILKRAMGKHDIYFAEDTEFSDLFEVQGPEAEIHQLFRPEIRSYFLRHFSHEPLRLEACGNNLLLHFGMMIYPEDSRVLIYEAVNIANFWMKTPVKYEIPPDIYFSGGL